MFSKSLELMKNQKKASKDIREEINVKLSLF